MSTAAEAAGSKASADSGTPNQQTKELVFSKDSLRVRLTCLFLLCFQNCTAILAIKYNSRVVADDGLKSLSTIVIALVISKNFCD